MTERSLASGHLMEALTYRTISYTQESLVDFNEYIAYLSFLERTYPRVHARMDRRMINGYSPVYHLKSLTPKNLPILLLGHYDVVPVEENTHKDWDRDPFSGQMHEGYIYGRGALDDKDQVISIMEALEALFEKGFEPKRDIYVAIGFDEEIGGEKGAKAIAEYFREENIFFDLVLDEGGAVVVDTVEGVKKPLALIGVAEKGSSMIKITAYGDGGHSSMPKKGSAIEILSKVVMNLTKNPMKPRLTSPVREMFHGMAPYMGAKGILLKHADSTFSLLAKVLQSNATMNSMVRTTMAMTMTRAGSALNVMPQEASGYVNIRLLPGDSFDEIMRHIKHVNKELDLSYEILVREEASMVTPHDSQVFESLEKIILKVYPDVKVLPYLMAGGSDSRKYEGLSENILRFSCIRMTNEDLDSLHSTNERIHVDNLLGMIHFYEELLEEYKI